MELKYNISSQKPVFLKHLKTYPLAIHSQFPLSLLPKYLLNLFISLQCHWNHASTYCTYSCLDTAKARSLVYLIYPSLLLLKFVLYIQLEEYFQECKSNHTVIFFLPPSMSLLSLFLKVLQLFLIALGINTKFLNLTYKAYFFFSQSQLESCLSLVCFL